MFKFYSAALCLCLWAGSVRAQVSAYVFSQSAGSYSPISGNMVHPAGWDDSVATVALPFSFTFNSTAYASISVNTNGYITFGAVAPLDVNTFPISSSAGYSGAVAAFGRDMISNASVIETAVAGVAPNRAFIIQWSNAQRFGVEAVAGDQFNFQIILQEGGGVVTNQLVEVVYGNCMATSTSSLPAQVGLRGATNADFNNRAVLSNWSASVAGTTNTAQCVSSNTVLPATGLTFTWAPPPPCTAPAAQPTALIASSISSSTISGSFTAAVGAPGGYLVVMYPAGATVTHPVNGVVYVNGANLGVGRVLPVASLNFGAAFLTALTTYDFYVYAYNTNCTGAPAYLTTSPLSGSFTTTAPALPQCITNISPTNGSTGHPINITLDWNFVATYPAISSFDIYFGTSSALVAAEDGSVKMANSGISNYTLPQPLNYGTTYYWKVVPINALGRATGCPVNSFTTYTPVTVTTRPGGGLWSSTSTWQSGVLPKPGDDVLITDGAVVTVDMAVTGIRNLTIGQGGSGVLQWVNSGNNPMTLYGNLTIAGNARFLPYANVNAGQSVNIGGNLVNNGFANLAVFNTVITMNGSQQALGSLNQSISGTGNFAGTVTQGIVHSLFFQNTGTSSITTTRSLVTSNLVHAAGTLNTNGKLSIDNTAQVYGQSLNTQVANVVVTNMGSGYTSAPVAYGTTLLPWASGGTGTAGSRYYTSNRVYLCTVSGAFSTTTPTHTSGILSNGTASLLWLSPTGTAGRPFTTSTVVTGSQYFYGTNLYTCTATGTPSASSPPVHVSGSVASGTAVFRYAGTAATVSVNYDAANQNIRSVNLTNPGSGYTSEPSIGFTPTTGTNAIAFALLLPAIPGPPNSTLQKSGSAVITGGLAINSNQSATAQSGVGSITPGSGGVNYTVAPTVGFGGPTGLNLVTAGGSGFSSLPTVTVTGGTLVSGTALTSANFTVTASQGRVVSVYLNAGTTAAYSVPPALSITDGGGTGATLAFPAGCWPAATALIGANGQLSNFTITNTGYGYVTAPVVSIGAVSGTTLGGTFTTAAGFFTCNIALYNLTISTIAPATVAVPHPDDVAIPASRKLNSLTIGSSTAVSGSLNLTGNLELFGASPLNLANGIVNLGGNTLLCSWPGYSGTAGTSIAHVTNGAITLSSRGGNANFNYPFNAAFRANTGTAASVADGSTIRTLTVRPSAAPTGAGAIGARAYRAIVNSGAVYGTNPFVALNWNTNDSLVTDNASLRISQSTALSGPWTERSLASATGSLPVTGTRTTSTDVPGPIVPTGNDYFAWTSNFTPPPPLSYTVSRTTGNAYQSIAPVAAGGDGTGIPSTANGDETAQSGINIAGTGFIYQGSPVTAMAIHPNGYIALNNGYSSYSNASSWDNTLGIVNEGYSINAAAVNKRNIIAPFYEDLDMEGQVMYYKITGTRVIVEWFKTGLYGSRGPQLYFQAVLDATDQSITFNYGNMQLYDGGLTARLSYTCGISGGYIAPAAKAGQVMQQQYENTTVFTHENGGTSSWGANGLCIGPEPRSSIKFTPGPYVPAAPPAATAPVNDNPAGAIERPVLSSFPNNIAWDTATHTTNLFTTRYATNTASPAVCGGAANARDVWFKFIAPTPAVTISIYGSAGFYPRLSVYDTLLAPLNNCTAGTGNWSETATTTATGLTVGNTYFVRVHHDYTGTQATATAAITNGVVTGLTVVPGTNYSNPQSFMSITPVNRGPRISFSGGGGNGAAAAGTNFSSGGPQTLSGSNISFTGGSGYTSAPAVTIESPDWGITGEFGIILYALPVNDECTDAIALTNLNNNGCINGQNAAYGKLQGATASPEPALCGTPNNDVWYKFTAADVNSFIKVQGTGSLNPAFQVFNGGAVAGVCAAKSYMACVNAFAATEPDTITLPTIIGNTYFIRVYHSVVGTAIGDSFSVCVTSARPPCITAPLTPANGGNSCAGPVVISWPAILNASVYDLYLDAGTDPATTLVYAGNASNFDTTLAPGAYTWRVVPKNNYGTGTACSNFSFTVNAAPTVSITPTGLVNVCAPGTLPLTLAATNAVSPDFKWLKNNLLLPGQTGSSFTATANGSYRLLVTDGITGCGDTSAPVQVVFNTPPVAVVTPAAATISCDSVKLTATAGGAAAIKITEFTLFRTGAGATAAYPAYLGTNSQDFVEISNTGGTPFDVGGFMLTDYGNNNNTAVHSFSIPPGTLLPAGAVIVIHLGTGTDDAANRFFNTGGFTDFWFSSSQVGIVLKDAYGNVVDALGCGGNPGSYTFNAATGVTPADWTGIAPNISGSAGVIRTGAIDTNGGGDWAAAATPASLQSIGAYNTGYSLSPLAVSWTPAAGLFTDAALTIPYTGGNLAQVFAKPGSTTIYTLQPPGLNGCTGPGSNITVTVLPASAVEWLGIVNTDWATAGNWKCGIIPTTTSDVVINGGAPHYPVVTLNIELKSLTLKPGAVVNIAPGFDIKLNGN